MFALKFSPSVTWLLNIALIICSAFVDLAFNK